MKKFLLLATFALSLFASCKEDNATDQTDPQKDEPIGFDIEVTSVASDNIIIDVTPLNYEGIYYVGLQPKLTYVENEATPMELAEFFVDLELNTYETDMTQADNLVLFTSEQKDISLQNVWTCDYATDYVICVFGVEGAEAKIVGEPVIKEATTADRDVAVSEMKIDIAIDSKSANGINVIFTPNNNNEEYVAALISESVLADFEGQSDRHFQDQLIASMDSEGTLSINTFTGENGVRYSALIPDTKYVAVAFGLDGMEASTELFSLAVATDGVDIKYESIEVEVVDVEEFDITLNFKRGEYPGNYYFGLQKKSVLDEECGGDAWALAQYIVETERLIYGTDFSVVDNMYIFNSDQTNISANEVWSVTSGTEYVVCVFGVDTEFGNITTPPTSLVVKTEGEAFGGGDGGEISFPENITFPETEFGEVKISNIEPTKFHFDVKPVDKEMKYFLLVRSAAEMTEGGYDSDKVAMLKDDVTNVAMLGATIGWGVLETLELALQVGDSNGDHLDLDPATDYIIYAYGLDINTLQPLTKIEEVSFTTAADSKASVKRQVTPKSTIFNELKH